MKTKKKKKGKESHREIVNLDNFKKEKSGHKEGVGKKKVTRRRSKK